MEDAMIQHPKNDRAFTLIELLVVLGIIVLLVAILIPTLGRARETSRKVGCLANLHGFGIGMNLYAESNGGQLPNGNPPGVWTSGAGASAVLVAFAHDYAPKANLFHCPTDPDPIPNTISTADYEVPDSARTSYEFYSVWFAPEYGPWIKLFEGKAPLVWDLDGGAPDSPIKNHLNGGNVVYADAHADWEPRKEWIDENWPSPADKYYPPVP